MSLTWSKQIEQWMDKNDVVECIDCEKPVAAINDNVGLDRDWETKLVRNILWAVNHP